MMKDAPANIRMDDVMSSIEKLNQRVPLVADDAAALTRSRTPPVVKSAVLARLLHRP